ncbi:Hypothetical predicted protein [Cloeon dipterum]|uniref:Uncharacterized protein n=1 Tax=Cloeon dipterum TaxID=197152 RepID=A0A8S1E0D8_9INSE|nr:Hypothetical predicted protein [Cloeon dipterum]
MSPFATTAVLLACAALLNASPVRVAHLQQVFVPVLAGYDVGQGLRVNVLQRGLLQNLYKYVVHSIWPNSENQQEEQQEGVEEQQQQQFNSAMKPNYPAISVQEGEYVVGPIEYAGQFWYFHYPEKPTYHNRPTSQQDEKGSISQVGIVSSAQNEEDLPQVAGIHSVPKAGLSPPPKDDESPQEEGSTPLSEIEDGNNEDQESSTSQTEEIPEGGSSLPHTEETTTLADVDAGKPEQEAEGILSKNSVPLPATRTVGGTTIAEATIKSAGVAGQVGGSRLTGFEKIDQAVHPVHIIPVEMVDLAGQAGNLRIYPYYGPPVAYFG